MEAQVAEAFQSHWRCRLAAVVRAPGRVNLIGEHIDYEGYGVLPMAIEQACYIAIGWEPCKDSPGSAPADSSLCSLHAANVDPGRYPAAALPLQPPEGPLPAGTPPWLKYVHAAYRGCVEFASSRQQGVPRQRGSILLMVGSSIPPAAGLSSSSALVVATALALLQLWGLEASPADVAEFTCKCERFVGTQGGGMDQAVSLLAQPGRALHVEFNPVRAEPVQLPPGAMFVVANSLAPSAKAETASYRFNLRVLECRVAAMLLAHLLPPAAAGAKALDWQQVTVLKQVEQHLMQHAAASGNSSAGAAELLVCAVQQLLPEATYTLQQVAELLGVQQQQLLQMLPQGLQAAAAAATQLQLQQRACHVFSEAQRVLTFKHTCQDPQLPTPEKLQQLGELLNASHTSCSQLYQCSCEELDSLVGVARAAGALGARLTGAGWGGCIVALVPAEQVPSFKQQLVQQYYQPLLACGVISEQELPTCLFASSPSAGAAVLASGTAQDGEAAAVQEPLLAAVGAR